METFKIIHKNKTLRNDLLILAIVLIAMLVGITIATTAEKFLVYTDFYQKNYHSQYAVTGPLAEQLDNSPATILDVYTAGFGPLGVVAVITGFKNVDIYLTSTETGLILNNDRTGFLPPLIFYFKPPSSTSTFDMIFGKNKILMLFSTNYTGLNSPFFGLGDSEVYYQYFGGPQYSWNLYVFNQSGSPILARTYHDATSGLLFTAWIYTPINGLEGISQIELLTTNYIIRQNIYVMDTVLIPVFAGWGVFHLWRLKKHPEDQYMKLTKTNIAQFFIRLLAWPIFDVSGTFTGLTQMDRFLIDGIGFGLMLFAVGIFSIFILIKFIHFIPGVQHPYGVPLYLLATLAYTIYSLGKHQASKEEKKNQH